MMWNERGDGRSIYIGAGVRNVVGWHVMMWNERGDGRSIYIGAGVRNVVGWWVMMWKGRERLGEKSDY